MKSPLIFFQNMSTEKIIATSSVTVLLTTLLNMKQILLALAIIILIDMLTGIRKSLFLKKVSLNLLKKDFWGAINSSGLRKTWRKSYEYGTGVLVFVILDSLVLKTSKFELMGGGHTLSELAVALACMVEIYSIYENMEAVSGRNLFKRMLSFLPSKVREFLENKK